MSIGEAYCLNISGELYIPENSCPNALAIISVVCNLNEVMRCCITNVENCTYYEMPSISMTVDYNDSITIQNIGDNAGASCEGCSSVCVGVNISSVCSLIGNFSGGTPSCCLSIT
jgi:hypothetical protein